MNGFTLTESTDPVGEQWHLKKPSFPIYEPSIASHLFVFALISIQEKKIFLIQGFYPAAAAAKSFQ